MAKSLAVRNAVAVVDPDNPSCALKPATSRCVAITPHETAAFDPTSAIMLNAAGAVTVRFEHNDADVTLTLLDGTLYPFRITHVRVTGTGPGLGIHGFY